MLAWAAMVAAMVLAEPSSLSPLYINNNDAVQIMWTPGSHLQRQRWVLKKSTRRPVALKPVHYPIQAKFNELGSILKG